MAYKITRTQVSRSSFKEADDHVSYYSNKTYLERLTSANEIISSIYGIPKETKLNRGYSTSRKHEQPI